MCEFNSAPATAVISRSSGLGKLSIFMAMLFLMSWSFAPNAFAADWTEQFEGGIVALRCNRLDEAERAMKRSLQQVASSDTVKQSKCLKALGLIYTARAVESEKTYRRSNLTVNDLLSTLVILLIAGSLVMLVLKHGPERPHAVSRVERWLKGRSSPSDDGATQFLSSMLALLICALAAGVLFLLLFGGIRLIAFLEEQQDRGSGAAPLFVESREAYSKAFALLGKQCELPNRKLISIYRSFESGTDVIGASSVEELECKRDGRGRGVERRPHPLSSARQILRH